MAEAVFPKAMLHVLISASDGAALLRLAMQTLGAFVASPAPPAFPAAAVARSITAVANAVRVQVRLRPGAGRGIPSVRRPRSPPTHARTHTTHDTRHARTHTTRTHKADASGAAGQGVAFQRLLKSRVKLFQKLC